MAKVCRLDNASLLYRGKKLLQWGEAYDVIYKGLRKKLRARVERLLKHASLHGEATMRWNYTWRISAQEDHWVQLHIKCTSKGYFIYLSGPRAPDVLRKINGDALLRPTRARLIERCDQDVIRRRRESRKRRKQRQREAKRALQKASQTPKQKRSRKRPVREAHGEVPAWTPPLRKALKAQFHHTMVFWNEAVDLVAYALEVRSVWRTKQQKLLTPQQVAAAWIHNALEETRCHFAQIKCGDFCLRLDVVGGRWKGDLTRFTISCSKDNKNPCYRRLRARMRQKLLGLSARAQVQRRQLVWQSELMAA